MTIGDTIKFGLLGAGAIALLSGCTSKIYSCTYKDGFPKGDKEHVAIFVNAKESWRSPSAGYNVKTRETHLLQNMADTTLKHSYKYFAIASPHNKVNNVGGSLINTPEGFLEACAPSSANPFTFGNSPCGYSAEGAMSYATLYVYNERPHDVLTYDAQEVKDYLIKNNLWRSDGIEEIQEFCNIVTK